MLLTVVLASSVAALLAPPVLLALALRVIAAPRTAQERPCRPSIRPVAAAFRARHA
ncbi:MAG TPA: hypothetical protein VN903_31150 [Polyangia bacterium]|jgi:hypothetical protein|nr:hypothetical protein [Polyangia bacterium]